MHETHRVAFLVTHAEVEQSVHGCIVRTGYDAVMTTARQRARHLDWLLELTAIPTAAGREDRVVAWIETWLNRRRHLELKRDRAGNLLITRTDRPRRGGPDPIYITAHLDHPAFVVRAVLDERRLELEFRGGVQDPYFHKARIEIFDADDQARPARLVSLDEAAKPFKRVIARLEKPADTIAPGDVARWIFPGPTPPFIDDDNRLHTHACDDLAAVAAALGLLDVVGRRKGFEHVGVLFTVAEEVGFIGAIAACEAKTPPKRARLICLENSRSFAESPIGGGPIVRVGDRISVFSPALTNRISGIMENQASDKDPIRWQRKLMPGGACEATVFSAYGYASTCVCLPLGNYHNMVDIDGVRTGTVKRPRVGPEFISVDDFHGLVDLLRLTCARLDEDDVVARLPARFRRLMDERGFVLDETS